MYTYIIISNIVYTLYIPELVVKDKVSNTKVIQFNSGMRKKQKIGRPPPPREVLLKIIFGQ